MLLLVACLVLSLLSLLLCIREPTCVQVNRHMERQSKLLVLLLLLSFIISVTIIVVILNIFIPGAVPVQDEAWQVLRISSLRVISNPTSHRCHSVSKQTNVAYSGKANNLTKTS